MRNTGERAESRANKSGALSNKLHVTELLAKLASARSAAAAEVVATHAKAAKAEENVIAAKAGVAGAAVEIKSLQPERYIDSDYWEERHAKSLESKETYEWYTGYPDEALQKAFPPSSRGKKMLVVGCGNSELSEMMCKDGFRDVLSIDTSKSAIEQMTARARPFNTTQTKCRYQVMDACRLDKIDAEAFGGVVDKGTIDAVLSGDLEPARRICQEAMRVLEPGGTFLIISSTPGEKLLQTLLSMCGPGSASDPPLLIPVPAGATRSATGADPFVYAYIVRKSATSGGSVASTHRMQQLEKPDEGGAAAVAARTARYVESEYRRRKTLFVARQEDQAREQRPTAERARLVEGDVSKRIERPPEALPWGSLENFSEDMDCATYELKLDTELSSSKLSVEIEAARVKAYYGPRSGGASEVLIDREFHDKVTAESTWCIEDKRVLVLNLYKRTARRWGRPFNNDLLKPSAVTKRDETGEVKAIDVPVVDGAMERKVSPAVPDSLPLKPVPVPPTAPRKHERSPKVGHIAGRNFKAPERFLVEGHIGIKKLQLYFSKPPGFKVTTFQVSRAGPELCEVRFVCRDETGSGLPDAHFLQRANLGRKDFNTDLASCTDEAEEALCVVGVPYGEGSPVVHSEEDGVGSGDLDDEGMLRVARLRCRFCKHPITPAGTGLVVRAMPSGRWDECIEDMICYDGPQAVPLLASDVNFARPGRCLMAQVEVLLHPRDVIQGAVRVVSMLEESEDGFMKQSFECARCDLPLGRPATSPDGHGHDSSSNVAEGGIGHLLLKHSLLGDDDGANNGQGENSAHHPTYDRDREEQEAATGRCGVGTFSRGKASASRQLQVAGSAETRPRCVFENRTATKWLLGEMAYYKERDGCARFIVSAKGRSPTTPKGSLSLVLAKMNSLVSVDGSNKPARAHQIAFREESREEAHQADMEERRGGESELRPQGEGATGDGELGKSTGRTAAQVPARLLEVSYGEYRAVRQRLLETAWAGVGWSKLDSRGYSYSYLF